MKSPKLHETSVARIQPATWFGRRVRAKKSRRDPVRRRAPEDRHCLHGAAPVERLLRFRCAAERFFDQVDAGIERINGSSGQCEARRWRRFHGEHNKTEHSKVAQQGGTQQR
jgi:hypothetical protein